MFFYPINNHIPKSREGRSFVVKQTTKDDESGDLKYRTEKHHHEKLLKTLRIDNEF